MAFLRNFLALIGFRHSCQLWHDCPEISTEVEFVTVLYMAELGMDLTLELDYIKLIHCATYTFLLQSLMASVCHWVAVVGS